MQNSQGGGGRNQSQYNSSSSSSGRDFTYEGQVKINAELKKQLELKTQEALDLTGKIEPLKTGKDFALIFEQNQKLHKENSQLQKELEELKAEQAESEVLLSEAFHRNDNLRIEINESLSINDGLRAEINSLRAVPASSTDIEELSRENETLRFKIHSLAAENFELINKERIAVFIDYENAELRERLKYLDTENKQLIEEAKSVEPSESKKKKCDKHDGFCEEEIDKLPEIDELTELRRRLERQEEAHKQELKDLIEENQKLAEENQSLMFIMQENTNTNEANDDSLLARTLTENERLKADLRNATFSNPARESSAANNLGQQNDEIRKKLEQEVKTLRERQVHFDSLLECNPPTKDSLLISHTTEVERLQKERDKLSGKVTRYTRMANNKVNNQDDANWQIANTAILDLESSNKRILELEAENFKLKIGITMGAQTNEESHNPLVQNLTQSACAEFQKKEEQLKEKQRQIEELEINLNILRDKNLQLNEQNTVLNRDLDIAKAEVTRLGWALTEKINRLEGDNSRTSSAWVYSSSRRNN